jgi:signal transduction histidine kinase
MNRAPPTGLVFARLLAPALTTAAVTTLLLPSLFAVLLGLTPAQELYVRSAFAFGSLGVLALLAGGLVVGLRGVGGAAPDDEVARRRILRLPVRLGGAVAVFGGGTTVAATFLRLLTADEPASLVFGVGLASAAFVGFLAVPMYVVARAVLQRYALFFARETLPKGRRVPIGLLAGYTVLAVAAAALVPAAVFGNARLDAARARAGAARAQASARRLARVLEGRSATEAVRLVARTHLVDAIVVLRMPSGQLLPEQAAADAGGELGQEAALGGELHGGAIRIVARPRPGSRAALLLVALGLIGLATLIATSLASALTRDARGVTRQVEALADEAPPPAVATVSSSEVRRVALAVNRLLDRIPRLQLERFLAVERTDEARRLKSMFLANMSHDLRSPLNSILGFSELLTRGLEGAITDVQRDKLEDINATGNQLLRLLSEILDTARAESGHLDLERKATPPATFVTQARKEALRGRPERVGDRLTIDLQAGVAAVHVDALRMQQALTHLFDWAIEAARDGAVRVEIADRDRDAGRAFVIEVLCVGTTTTAEAEALLFQPFRKVPGLPGLQLALPLARRIIEAHGGTVEPYGERYGEPYGGPQGGGNADQRRPLGVRVILPRVGPR